VTSYTVEFTKAAAKDVRKLDHSVRRRVLAAVQTLADDPRPRGAVKLTGFTDAWRIRIGDYRVLYEVIDEKVLVTVFRVGSRGDVYQGL
jgi:mRNA interferase RelE/StbE